MTSRERVRRCLEFERPDRVPRDLWCLPIARREHGAEAIDSFFRRWPRDLDSPGVPNPALAALTRGSPYEPGTFRDEWGCEFVNIQAGVIGEVKQPLLSDWAKLEELRPPEAALRIDVEAVNGACAKSGRFVLANCCPRPFERMQFLRGSENLYLDLAEEPDELEELLRRVHGFFCKELEVWSRTDVDGLMCMDDWGAQQRMLISPQQWRRRFKPLYAEYARIAHGAGKKLFMHSDGWIFDIYEDLIEAGVDAINSQLFCMDLEAIGRRFAGRIAFWGEIDRQRILPFGAPEEARAAVRRVARSLWRPEGGVIAQFEFGAGTRLANAEAVFETWDKLVAGREGGAAA